MNEGDQKGHPLFLMLGVEVFANYVVKWCRAQKGRKNAPKRLKTVPVCSFDAKKRRKSGF